MAGTSFWKGAMAGGVGAAVMTSATAALAGTGIGAVFNLGQTNTVNARSTLDGSVDDAQLAVGNTGTGPSTTALRLAWPSCRRAARRS
ncbi:MAG TPA: hypothetical protein VF533_06280 [Solirubrobacteraceae bacterium]|jgi:hypothetical protein